MLHLKTEKTLVKIEIQPFVHELLCLGVKELEKLSAEEQRELLKGRYLNENP